MCNVKVRQCLRKLGWTVYICYHTCVYTFSDMILQVIFHIRTNSDMWLHGTMVKSICCLLSISGVALLFGVSLSLVLARCVTGASESDELTAALACCSRSTLLILVFERVSHLFCSLLRLGSLSSLSSLALLWSVFGGLQHLLGLQKQSVLGSKIGQWAFWPWRRTAK